MPDVSNPSELLAELRDIHLPDPVSWWPPAPGWWLLLGLLVTCCAILAWWVVRRGTFRLRDAALQRLGELASEHSRSGDDQALLRALSRLLRQAAVCHFPREVCSGLTGKEWLEFLDRAFPDRPFSNGVGTVLAQAPYHPAVTLENAEQLVVLCRRWLQNLPPVSGLRGGQ